MSFIVSLIKGFFRSAVNQVGRDGGKIVSKKIYGDNNSSSVQKIKLKK
jgi:hypothetical protein